MRGKRDSARLSLCLSRGAAAIGLATGRSGAAGADDCVATEKRVRLLNVDGSLTDDLARWLAVDEISGQPSCQRRSRALSTRLPRLARKS